MTLLCPCRPPLLLACLAFTAGISMLGASAQHLSLRGRRGHVWPATTPGQILVFDAGSSGTRVHIFNLSPLVNGNQVPQINMSVRTAQTLKIKPGLSTFAKNHDLAGVEKNIMGLLEFANKFVPLEHRSKTPAILKATAGLRAVPAEAAEAVLGQVRETLMKSSYLFETNWAGIIPGVEEGGLAWVAANYLAGTFDGSAHASIGVVELGGGSVQVSFEVDGSAEIPTDDRFTFTTASGRKYSIYAHSYMGYGQDYAQAELQKRPMHAPGMDPCYPNGYRRSGNIKGGGDASACQGHIKKHLFEGRADAPGNYAGSPKLTGKFIATENFFNVRDELKLPLLGSPDAMTAAANATCAQAYVPTKWEQDKMEDGTSNPLQPLHCFGLSYHIVLLTTLGAFGSSEVQIAKQLGGGDIDWAVGAALVHVLGGGGGAISISTEESLDKFTAILFGAAVMITTVFVFLGLKFRKRQCAIKLGMDLRGGQAEPKEL